MSFISTLVTGNSLQLLTSFLALSLVAKEVQVASAEPCLSFDSNFNLYAFGFGGKDFNLGTQDKWGSVVTPTDITTTGRPPFDGTPSTCYLAQFFNAIYVLNGDKSNPTNVYIYDVTKASWSTQAVSPGGPDPASLVVILDHDTNVFYGLSEGTMFSLDLGTQTQAKNTPLSWNKVGTPSFPTLNYRPTMALAQNHIHFFGVPGTTAGQAYIFVIHFSFFQPNPQAYPDPNGGSSFPSVHGSTASFPLTTGVQQEIAFIPDDGSSTYVINVENNSTHTLAGPLDKSLSMYTASPHALIQLTSTGSLAFLPYSPGNSAANKAATWSKINVQGLPTLSTNSSATGLGGGSSAAGGGNATATASSAGPSKAGSSGSNAASLKVAARVTMFVGVVTIGGLILL